MMQSSPERDMVHCIYMYVHVHGLDRGEIDQKKKGFVKEEKEKLRSEVKINHKPSKRAAK